MPYKIDPKKQLNSLKELIPQAIQGVSKFIDWSRTIPPDQAKTLPPYNGPDSHEEHPTGSTKTVSFEKGHFPEQGKNLPPYNSPDNPLPDPTKTSGSNGSDKTESDQRKMQPSSDIRMETAKVVHTDWSLTISPNRMQASSKIINLWFSETRIFAIL